MERVIICEQCKGKGKINKKRCKFCNGYGTIKPEKICLDK